MNMRGPGLGVAIAATVACVTGVIWAGAAAAASEREGVIALVSPTTQMGDAVFYDFETLDIAWTAATNAFSEELPPGYDLPRHGPWTRQDLGPGNNLFEAQLVDLVIAANYRCAWLSAGLEDRANDDDVDRVLMTYWTLPSVARFDQTGLGPEGLAAVAVQLGYQDQHQALYDLSCAAPNGGEE